MREARSGNARTHARAGTMRGRPALPEAPAADALTLQPRLRMGEKNIIAIAAAVFFPIVISSPPSPPLVRFVATVGQFLLFASSSLPLVRFVAAVRRRPDMRNYEVGWGRMRANMGSRMGSRRV